MECRDVETAISGTARRMEVCRQYQNSISNSIGRMEENISGQPRRFTHHCASCDRVAIVGAGLRCAKLRGVNSIKMRSDSLILAITTRGQGTKDSIELMSWPMRRILSSIPTGSRSRSGVSRLWKKDTNVPYHATGSWSMIRDDFGRRYRGKKVST
jgi:hypothetical protein